MAVMVNWRLMGMSLPSISECQANREFCQGDGTVAFINKEINSSQSVLSFACVSICAPVPCDIM